MVHPAVHLRFLFSENQPAQVFQALLQAARDMKGLTLEEEDVDTLRFGAAFRTPACGWIDEIEILVKEGERADAAVVEARSHCTNVCCGWCGPCRCLFGWFHMYSDNGKNTEHLRVLADATHLAFEEVLVEKKGIALYSQQRSR
eukprot:TRINITY_DN4841_c0_g2_i1.p1 TRINITY_DN4841_c0_g2~~TRINITY_DN4841_c0_g2_i1.p1  ORF type:complete len:144 (-),score=29.89 TRINITY_DN4841_c0_g2_i1:122-553(-)